MNIVRCYEVSQNGYRGQPDALCSQGVGVCITSRVYVCVKYETLHIGTSGRMCGRVVGYGV